MTFDEQVAALRGKVEPRCFNGLKARATPEQWAANLDYGSAYYKANPEPRAARKRVYRVDNMEQRRAYDRAYFKANRARQRVRRREYSRTRRRNDPAFRLACALRERLCRLLQSNAKSGSAVRDLGCTTSDLRAHIERQWHGGMTWETWGRGPGKWQIDHIYPLAKADLADRAQFLAVCNWRNLRPLWFDDHAPKGDTITPEAQALFDSLMAEFKAKEVA